MSWIGHVFLLFLHRVAVSDLPLDVSVFLNASFTFTDAKNILQKKKKKKKKKKMYEK